MCSVWLLYATLCPFVWYVPLPQQRLLYDSILQLFEVILHQFAEAASHRNDPEAFVLLTRFVYILLSPTGWLREFAGGGSERK